MGRTAPTAALKSLGGNTVPDYPNQLLFNLFSSPSTTTSIIMGHNANGLAEWKNKKYKPPYNIATSSPQSA
ncbi:hypothetical protein CEK71_10950 [Methylovulum psychrotolerans]|uniref:Uncharacterized protein n=1 Tax=Methylovulum psychrotolerans TaxID=1704499 RepID=A0A1Z4BZ23_9GAMM|nr:hypothetical protein CEK71_10950 [Methylovulum psychrotolerans]